MYNLFCNDISIDYPLLNMWEDKLISQKIIDHSVLWDPDNQERKNYTILLYNDNFEDDLDAAIANTKIKIN